jgi:hypothetical protein
MDGAIEERSGCGRNGADGKFCSKELETIGDTPGNGTANQSHCRCRTKHDPEFFWPEPPSPQERPAKTAR